MAAPFEPLDDLGSLCQFFNQFGDSFYLTDRSGHFVYANPIFERVTGYSQEEVAGKTPRILKSGVHPRQVYEELWSTLSQGRPFRFIFTNRKKNGELFEEGVIISPLRDASGEVTYFAAVGRVIDQFRQTYDVFTLLSESLPISSFVLQRGRFFYMNRLFGEVTGYRPEELLEREWTDIVHGDDREAAASAARLSEPGAGSKTELRILARDGRELHVLLTLQAAQFRGIPSVSGDFLTGSFIDITERKLAEQEVKRALSMHIATLEATADGILITDTNGKITGNNRRFLEMWRIAESEAASLPSEELFINALRHVADSAGFEASVRRAFEDLESETTELVELKDGSIYELYSKPQRIEGQAVGRVWAFRDVTEKERLSAKLRHLASHDALTGLPNRRFFQEELERWLEAAPAARQPLALLFIDVDGFKLVNDNFGHAAGDDYLRSLSRTLSAALRSGDLLARLGGDEFGVLLRNCDREEALLVAGRLLNEGSRPVIQQAGRVAVCHLSIGCAVSPEDGCSADELLSHADTAMYRAKRGGNSIAVYDESVDAITPHEAWLRRSA